MKIEFINKNPKDGGKGAYRCHICHKRFDWSEHSYRYGKAEYTTLIEQNRHEKYFCSQACMKGHANKKQKDENNQKQ